jgi:teichuronic acid exporter
MEKIFTKRDVVLSFLWKYMERGGTQGVNFILSIILARLLLPEEFGLIAIILIFINIANVFVQSGLNTALIQKKDADEIDFSSVFYSSILLAVIIYFILFFCAPLIADFYNIPGLKLIIRVLAVTLFFGAVNSIQNAVISRNLHFKKLFYSSTGGTLFSGVTGIILAYMGQGVWALVWQQLIFQIVVTAIMWFTVKWRPKLLFSGKRLKKLLSYSWKLLISNLISALFLDLRSLIIGKIYNAEMLGFFNRGKQFPSVIISNINDSIQAVMFPTISSVQDNRKRVKDMVRLSIRTSSFIVFPMMVGLAIIAEPLVILILTEKWLPSVPFLQIFCLTYLLMPIHTANLQAIAALGYSDKILRIELLKKCLEFLVLIISLNYGIYAIALGTFITSLISLGINSYPNKQLLDYSLIEQLNDVKSPLFLSAVMGIFIFCIKLLNLSVGLTLISQIFLGLVIYLGLALIFKVESFTYILNMVRSLKGLQNRESEKV